MTCREISIAGDIPDQFEVEGDDGEENTAESNEGVSHNKQTVNTTTDNHKNHILEQHTIMKKENEITADELIMVWDDPVLNHEKSFRACHPYYRCVLILI